MRPRRLRLAKESLTDLAPAELAAVAAGSVFCTSAVTFCDLVCRLTESDGCPVTA